MKKNLKLLLGGFVYFAAFLALFTVPVKAYIDPSATTYVIQAVAAAVIAVGACFTIFRHKIAALFKGKKENEKKEIVFKDEAAEATEAADE